MKINFNPRNKAVSAEPSQIWNEHLQQVGRHQDRDAFAALFSHFSPLLKSFLMKNGIQSPEGAEEIVQETMIKVWRKAATFSPDQASASTWIYTIARNTKIDMLRRQDRQNPNRLNADDIYGASYDNLEAHSPQSSLVQLRIRSQVADKLAQLPPEQAEVLNLMYFEGKSGQKIADTLGLPLGTVKSRIRLALAKLKPELLHLQAETAAAEG